LDCLVDVEKIKPGNQSLILAYMLKEVCYVL
jgi:hypothetical protein